MAEEQKVIEWTRPMLARFRKAYSVAVEAGADTFTFDGNVFVVGYARYLIQYLETQFKK